MAINFTTRDGVQRGRRAAFNKQIYLEACEWFVNCRLGDLDVTGRHEFDRWLRGSPLHLRAYLEIAAIWDEGESLAQRDGLEPEALIRRATGDRGEIVALGDAVPYHESSAADSASVPANTVGRVRRQVMGLAFSILVGVGGLVVRGYWQAWMDIYATGTGEQRSLILDDKSTAELDSCSQIRIRYSEHERTVDLAAGQALFRVTKDEERPFVVETGQMRIRALGTEFDVYKRSDGATVVSVVEGKVAVVARAEHARVEDGDSVATNERPARANMVLVSGEQLTVTPTGGHMVRHFNVMDATAWTQHRLVFESATLAEVATEFNRYNRRKLIVDATGIGAWHISGVFSSSDPEPLIHFLRARGGFGTVETSSEIRLEKNSSQGGYPLP